MYFWGFKPIHTRKKKKKKQNKGGAFSNKRTEPMNTKRKQAKRYLETAERTQALLSYSCHNIDFRVFRSFTVPFFFNLDLNSCSHLAKRREWARWELVAKCRLDFICCCLFFLYFLYVFFLCHCHDTKYSFENCIWPCVGHWRRERYANVLYCANR